MDCCENKTKLKNEEIKGGGSGMNTRIWLWITVGALFLIALYLTFKTSSIDISTAQNTAGAARSAASSAMVGGC